MTAVEKARAWLHGEIDTDPAQLVRELVAEREQPASAAVPEGAAYRLVEQLSSRFAVMLSLKSAGELLAYALTAAPARQAVEACRCTGLLTHLAGTPGYPCAEASKPDQAAPR